MKKRRSDAQDWSYHLKDIKLRTIFVYMQQNETTYVTCIKTTAESDTYITSFTDLISQLSKCKLKISSFHRNTRSQTQRREHHIHTIKVRLSNERIIERVINHDLKKLTPHWTFKSDAITAILKRHLRKTRHKRIIDHWDRSTLFLHSSPFYPIPQNSMLKMFFNRPDTHKSASSHGGIYIHPGPTRLSISTCISIGSAVIAQLTAEISYTLQCASKCN